MADVNSNININFNTDAALAQLRQLQAGLSRFHQSLAEGNLAAANAQKGLNAQLLQSVGATGKFSASQVKVAGSTLAFTSALEKNKLSLREYYRYTMAAATANTRVLGRAFAEEREILNRARRDRVKALQAQYIQMNKSNAGFMDAIRIMPKSLAMASGKFTELGTRIQYAAQRQQFLNQLLKQGSTQLLNFGKNTQWAGRQLMVGLTMPLALFGSMAAKTFRELEEEIVKFKRVYGNAFTNDAETDLAVENIRRLASEYTKYGVSVTKTIEMAANAAAAGFSGKALNTQVETATKLAVLGQIEQQQALETTMSLQNAFGISSEELAKKIDFLNAVENQTVLSIEDLTIAIPKAAPVIKQLGGNVEDLAFFMTAMKEGGINASEGANALKSGLASLINPSKKASEFLANLGINISGIVEANKGDIKATVIGFSQALDTLDPLNRARAIEQMFGKFQFARLSTLFQNVTKDGTQASRALSLAGASIEELAILSEREMKKIEDSVGVKFQAAVEQFKQEIMPLGKIFLEALTPVVKFFGTLFEKFNGLSDQTKKVVAVIVGVVAGLGPVLLMTFGLLANGVANAIKFFALLRGGIARLNGQTNVLGAGFTYMTQEQIENAASSQSLHQTHTRLIEVFNVEKASVNALASSYNSLSTQMRAMASQNPALFAGGAPGARAATSKLPPVRKYKDGILTVPGPKGAGDIQPAMLAPGEAVIPAKTTDKYRGLLSAIFNDSVPGFMAGRIPAGRALNSTNDLIMQRINRSAYPGTHPERKSGPQFAGMPKTFEEASQSRQIVEKIAQQVKLGRFGAMPPSDFGTLLQPFSGRSFPVRGVGGIYRKPNGELVVVKPTMDDKTALAEVRATEIAREVHGLVSPKQSIKTMIDPTDPTGQRKFVVVESPYDPRIAAMNGKFSKSDMIKQLVASTLRGDKDLQQPNLSGNVLSDVGTAGVFDRASGFRDFAKVMPSMEEQAIVNLLGVKGGAKKFFAQETSSLAANMTPAQYNSAIKTEISQSIPKLKNLIKSWDADLGPEEKIVYNNMLARLEAGAKTDWAALQPLHARAGEGIKKLEDGLLDSKGPTLEQKEQLNKYALASVEDSQAKRDDLKNYVENEFRKKLKTADPTRAPIIKTAWDGGSVITPSGNSKSFSSRQTKFLDEISKMTPINVDGVTKYLSKDDMESFAKDPDHRAKFARTKQEVIDNVLYRMGVIPNEKGIFVDKGGFEGRFGNPQQFAADLRSSNKAAGGGKGKLSKIVRPEAMKQKDEYNARIGKPLETQAARTMKALGLSDAKIIENLSPELSHISATGNAGIGGRDDIKFKTGTAQYDAWGLNRYIGTGSSRFKDMLKWNNKDGLNPIGLNLSLLDEYEKAADFMATGRHPETREERALVARAAELESLTADYKAKGNKIPTTQVKLPRGAGTKAKALLAILADPKVNPSRLLNLEAQRADQVLVNPGNETKVTTNPKTGEVKAERQTYGNTGAKPANAVASSGSSRDIGTTLLAPNQTIATRRQFQNFRGMRTVFPSFDMPGMIDGDPRLDSQSRRRGPSSDGLSKAAQRRIDAGLIQKANLLRKDNRLTETQIQRAIEKIRMQRTEAEITKARVHQEKMALNEAKKNTPQTTRQARKTETQQKRMARQQKIGNLSGGLAMGLGMAGSGMMMAGNQTGGMAMMGASAVAGLAPMFASMGPVGLIATGVVAAGAGLFLFNKHLENAAKKQAEYVRSVSATTEKMQKVGEITNKVGASEIMARRREGGQYQTYNESERKGSDFGQKFLTSEIGKSIQNAFSSNMAKKGSKQAAEDLSFELSQYISDGLITAEDAKSIAYQIGVNLKDATLTTNIQGNLRMLVGPNGENLINEPLQARMRIVSMADARSQRTIKEMFDSKASGNSGVAEAAQLASYSGNTIQVAQAQADAITIYAEKQKKILEAELLSTKNKERQVEIQKEINALANMQIVANAKIAAAIATAVKNFNVATGGGRGTQDSFFDASKADVKAKYAGTDFAPAAQRVLDKAARFDEGGMDPNIFKSIEKGQALEAKVQFIMASGVMNPKQIEAMLRIFEGDLTTMDVALDIGIRKQGGARMGELTSLLTGVDGEVAKTITLALIRKSPEDFDKNAKTLALLMASDGYEVSMSAYLETNGVERLTNLTNKLDAIEKIKNPIVKVTDLQNVGLTADQLAQLSSDWEYFLKLDPITRKEAIQTFTMITDAVMNFDSPEARKEWAANYASQQALLAGDVGSKEYTEEYNKVYNISVTGDTALLASLLTQEKYGTPSTTIVKNPKDSQESTATKTDPLDFLKPLAMDLKQVRDNAFNALTPVQSLLAAFTNKKTQKDAFNLFDGIQNRLLRFGAGKGLRDAVSSMSAEDFAKVAAQTGDRALFTFAKGKPRSKDTITGLTKTGKAVDQGMMQRDIGNFTIANQETIKNIQDQTKAYNILISSGLTAGQALEVVSDQGQAAAIAAGAIKKSDPNWKEYISNIKTSSTELERQAVLNKAIRENEDFKIYKEMPKLVSQMKGLGYSTDQIDAVLGDPELAKFLVDDLKDGKLDAKAIANYLNSIEERKIIDIQTNFNAGEYSKSAQPGLDLIDESFAVGESLLRTGVDERTTSIVDEMNKNSIAIRDAEASAIPFREEIEKINREITKDQRAIEEKYSRPIEKLSEEVNDLNRELEMNPLFGDRAIQSIQDENSALSNDLTLISNAADEVNKRYDEQADALQKVSDINQNIVDQQKQQLDLADAITSGDISAAARAVQEIRAANASRFADAQSQALQQARENALGSLTARPGGLTQEQINKKQFENSQRIYAMENDPRRIVILNQIRDKQDEIYKKEEDREAALLRIREQEDKINKIQVESLSKIEETISRLTYRNSVIQATIDKLVEEQTQLGLTQTEWGKIKSKIDANTLAGKDFDKQLGALLASTTEIDNKWKDILAKLAKYSGTPKEVIDEKDKTAAQKAEDKLLAEIKESMAGVRLGDEGDYLDQKGKPIVTTKTNSSATKNPVVTPALKSRSNLTLQYANGGLVPKYFAVGGYAKGTDTVPAMLTPGEFVMSKYAVQSYGVDTMKAINSGSSVGDSVYNYNLNLNVKSDANPDDIAKAVMVQIKSVDAQRIRGTRI